MLSNCAAINRKKMYDFSLCYFSFSQFILQISVMSAEDDAYALQAKSLVDDVIEMAIKRLETNISLMSEKEKTFESVRFSEISRESTYVRREDFTVDNIAWLAIGDFSVENGEKKINEFIAVS